MGALKYFCNPIKQNIIIILSKLTNPSKNKNQEKQKGLKEKTDLLTKTTKLKIQTHF